MAKTAVQNGWVVGKSNRLKSGVGGGCSEMGPLVLMAPKQQILSWKTGELHFPPTCPLWLDSRFLRNPCRLLGAKAIEGWMRQDPPVREQMQRCHSSSGAVTVEVTPDRWLEGWLPFFCWFWKDWEIDLRNSGSSGSEDTNPLWWEFLIFEMLLLHMDLIGIMPGADKHFRPLTLHLQPDPTFSDPSASVSWASVTYKGLFNTHKR